MAPLWYSYVRFSSAPQQWGDSQRRQLEATLAFCEQEGGRMAPDGSYADRGVSAAHGKNVAIGALSRFLKKVQEGEVKPGSVLCVENLDRLSREQIPDALGLFLDLIRAGVTVATTMPQRIYTRESLTHFGTLLEACIIMQTAWEENRKRGERVAAAFGRKRKMAAEQGIPPTKQTPGWIRLTPNGYELVEDRARIVRHMFALALQGNGADRIAAALRADPERFPPWGPSGTWSDVYVRRVLTDPATWGAYQGRRSVPGRRAQPDGPPVPGHYPPVVSLEDWSTAGRAIQSRRRAGGRRGGDESNLFTRLVHNAATGRKMNLRVAHGNGRTYRRLEDDVPDAPVPSGFGHTFPYDVLEEAILGAVAGLDVADLLPARSGGPDLVNDLGDAEKELRAVGEASDELQAQLSDPSLRPGVRTRVVAALGELDDRQRVLSDRIASLRERIGTPPTQALLACQDALRLLRTIPPADRPALRLRVKERLRDLLTGVWIVVQSWHKRAKIAHVQLHYRAGGWTTLVVQTSPKLPRNAIRLDLREQDLREGYPARAGARQRGA